MQTQTSRMTDMNKLEYVDYKISSKQLLATLHEQLLKNQFYDAYETSLKLQAETKLLTNAIKTWCRSQQDV